MFIVRKKYLIKLITFVFLLVLIISGIFLSERNQEKAKKTENDKTTFMLINNIYASLQAINTSFNKSIKIGTFENEKNEIYTQAYSIKNLIYFASPNMQNTAKWFSELCEYSKTDMTDNEKNSYYSEKILEATTLLLNICSNHKNESRIDEIEKIFYTEEKKEYYRNKLKTTEEDYPLLNNQIKADRSEITDLAKNILNFPISPKQFYGNYKVPKAICYSHLASYAEIFPSGKFLNRMAVENTTQKDAISDLTIHDAAKHYLTIYAFYTENCKEVYTKKTNKLMYFVFCPETISGNTVIINYNEPIKLAINLNDNSLKAFDASEYLKKHRKSKEKETVSLSANEIPSEISQFQIISNKIAIIGQKEYTEYCFTPDGQNKYYLLYHTDKSKETYTEDEYFRMLNIN